MKGTYKVIVNDEIEHHLSNLDSKVQKAEVDKNLKDEAEFEQLVVDGKVSPIIYCHDSSTDKFVPMLRQAVIAF